MTKRTIRVITRSGEKLFVTLRIPASVLGDSIKEWRYICDFIDIHLPTVVEWE
jgi:hypothetical protein